MSDSLLLTAIGLMAILTHFAMWYELTPPVFDEDER